LPIQAAPTRARLQSVQIYVPKYLPAIPLTALIAKK